MHSKIEKYRIILSRMAARRCSISSIFTTQSLWETKNEVLTFFLFFIGMILVGIASLGRMWCSLYIAGYKDDKLVTDGGLTPFVAIHCIFFSMIGLLGIGCAPQRPLLFQFCSSFCSQSIIHSLLKVRKNDSNNFSGFLLKITRKAFRPFSHGFQLFLNLKTTL